jgi:hypothetical protein
VKAGETKRKADQPGAGVVFITLGAKSSNRTNDLLTFSGGAKKKGGGGVKGVSCEAGA